MLSFHCHQGQSGYLLAVVNNKHGNIPKPGEEKDLKDKRMRAFKAITLSIQLGIISGML